jgi:hypothetical protein
MKVKRSFVVTLEVPDGVSLPEIRQYIREAVADYCKGTNPDEPLFALDGDKVTVRPLPEPKHTSKVK